STLPAGPSSQQRYGSFPSGFSSSSYDFSSIAFQIFDFLHSGHLLSGFRRFLLGGSRLGYRRCLRHGKGLMVSIQDSAVKFIPKFRRYRKADVLIAILSFTTWHGNEQAV